jgi:hypothetical protein
MKKRKPPIVLATCLVILLLGVAIFFRPRSANEHQVEATPPPPSAEQGERPKLNASDVASMASSSMASKRMKTGPAEIGNPSGKPSISVVKPSDYKPKPNDSSTSTQWYTDQTKK